VVNPLKKGRPRFRRSKIQKISIVARSSYMANGSASSQNLTSHNKRTRGAESDVNEKTASITFEQAEEQAWLEIERYLTTMNPYDFQEVVAALLRAMGYHVSWVSPPGKDHGIDILAAADPLGARGPRVKVQVRRRGEAVTADGLNAFMALLGDDDVGIFVSAGGFTKPAEEAARMQEKRKVTLIDLERFFDLWIEHYERLDDSARRRLPLQPIHFLAPSP
jgi:restriction system protein